LPLPLLLPLLPPLLAPPSSPVGAVAPPSTSGVPPLLPLLPLGVPPPLLLPPVPTPVPEEVLPVPLLLPLVVPFPLARDPLLPPLLPSPPLEPPPPAEPPGPDGLLALDAQATTPNRPIAAIHDNDARSAMADSLQAVAAQPALNERSRNDAFPRISFQRQTIGTDIYNVGWAISHNPGVFAWVLHAERSTSTTSITPMRHLSRALTPSKGIVNWDTLLNRAGSW
jgi:hypothetical protein